VFNPNNRQVLFNGATDQTITADDGEETFDFLAFDSTGTKTLENEITVQRNLDLLDNTYTLESNGHTINLAGNWNNEVGETAFNETSGSVILNGSSLQDINALNGETFYNLELINSADSGLVMNDAVTVTRNLELTDGILHTNDNAFTIENGVNTSGGSFDSYINGKITKVGLTEEFKFPVGDYRNLGDSVVNVYQPAALIPRGTNSSVKFKVEYFNENYVPGTFNPNNQPPRDSSLESVSTCNYWIIDRTNGAIDAEVKLFYNDSSCLTVGDASMLTVAKWSGDNPNEGQWENQGQSASDILMGSVTSNSVETFSPFTIGSGSGVNVLPIELLSFTAKAQAQTVKTEWITSTEINNDYFTLERSIDAQNWEPVATIDGAGNSTSELHYSHTDREPFAGISYYRLKQTDFDGVFSYSQVRAVEIASDGAFDLVQVYRAHDGLRLNYRSELSILTARIYDLRGKLIFSTQIKSKGSALIHPRLVRGTYLLRLSNGVDFDTEKFFY
jgi:hypothetical protein